MNYISYMGFLYEAISEVTKKNQEVALLADRIFNYVRYFSKKLTNEEGYIDTKSDEFKSNLISTSNEMVRAFGYSLTVDFKKIIQPDDKILNNSIINKMVSNGVLVLTRGDIDYRSNNPYFIDIPYYKKTIDDLLDIDGPDTRSHVRGAFINDIYVLVPFYLISSESGKMLPINQTLTEQKDNYRSLLIHELTHYYDSFIYELKNDEKDPDDNLRNVTEINARSNELIKSLENHFNNLFYRISTYSNPKTEDELDSDLESGKQSPYHLGIRGHAQYNVPLDKDGSFYRNYVTDHNELFRLGKPIYFKSVIKRPTEKFLNDILKENNSTLLINLIRIYNKYPEIYDQIVDNVMSWYTDFLERHLRDFPKRVIR